MAPNLKNIIVIGSKKNVNVENLRRIVESINSHKKSCFILIRDGLQITGSLHVTPGPGIGDSGWIRKL